MIIVIYMKPASISQTKTFISTKHIAKIQHHRNHKTIKHPAGITSFWNLMNRMNPMFHMFLVQGKPAVSASDGLQAPNIWVPWPVDWIEAARSVWLPWLGSGHRFYRENDEKIDVGNGGTTVEPEWKLVEFYGLYVWRHLLKWWTFLEFWWPWCWPRGWSKGNTFAQLVALEMSAMSKRSCVPTLLDVRTGDLTWLRYRWPISFDFQKKSHFHGYVNLLEGNLVMFFWSPSWWKFAVGLQNQSCCDKFDRSIHILVSSSPNDLMLIFPWFLLQSMFSEHHPPLFDCWCYARHVFFHCLFLSFLIVSSLSFGFLLERCSANYVVQLYTHNPGIVLRDNLQEKPTLGSDIMSAQAWFCPLFCHPLKLSFGCIPFSKWVRTPIQTIHLTGDLPYITGLCLLSTKQVGHIHNPFLNVWIMLNAYLLQVEPPFSSSGFLVKPNFFLVKIC